MELRYDRVLGRWVIVADHRGSRPLKETQGCPFCPGADEVPGAGWDVLILKNRYASLRSDAPAVPKTCKSMFRWSPALGDCEVVVFHPKHDLTLADLQPSHIEKVLGAWSRRTQELGSLSYVKYVLAFENKGKELGVSLGHPHGQIYALPFVPPVLRKELLSARKYHAKQGTCLFCDLLRSEEECGERVVHRNESFTTFMPFAPSWPYGVVIYSRRHVQSLPCLDLGEVRSLAVSLKDILVRFDNLFCMSFPYVMVFHQSPPKGDYPYFHLHIEFYPPYREKDKLKFYAGVEQGGGTPTYDYKPEDKALDLRSVSGSERG